MMPEKQGVPPSAVAAVRLPSAVFDELCAYARAQNLNVSQVIRAAIEAQLVRERRALPRRVV